jgi:hypothetical protein
MKPYHLRRPPWSRAIRENRACYVSELPTNPVNGWTYILPGNIHHYYLDGKHMEVNPAWTFAEFQCHFLYEPPSYTSLLVDRSNDALRRLAFPIS